MLLGDLPCSRTIYRAGNGNWAQQECSLLQHTEYVRQVSSQVSVLQQNTNALQQLQFMKVATEPDNLYGTAWTLLRSAAVEIMLMGQ